MMVRARPGILPVPLLLVLACAHEPVGAPEDSTASTAEVAAPKKPEPDPLPVLAPRGEEDEISHAKVLASGSSEAIARLAAELDVEIEKTRSWARCPGQATQPTPVLEVALIVGLDLHSDVGPTRDPPGWACEPPWKDGSVSWAVKSKRSKTVSAITVRLADDQTVSATPKEGDRVVVELGYRCGPLCGSGQDLTMVFTHGHWFCEKVVDSWIS